MRPAYTLTGYIGTHTDGVPMYEASLAPPGKIVSTYCAVCNAVGFTGNQLLQNLQRCDICHGTGRLHFINPDPEKKP